MGEGVKKKGKHPGIWDDLYSALSGKTEKLEVWTPTQGKKNVTKKKRLDTWGESNVKKRQRSNTAPMCPEGRDEW